MRSQVSDWCFSFPRIRGDVPFANAPHSRSARFSPHTRGCSGEHCVFAMVVQVFPAYAGMFRLAAADGVMTRRFPRIRGDVPENYHDPPDQPLFSPHTRGCSPKAIIPGPVNSVFPAYAGMFLIHVLHLKDRDSFPRIRGDVPRPGFVLGSLGWVFPAYAGMFPAGGKWWKTSTCFPRIRGDVPGSHKRHGCTRSFSPHTRGCSGRSRKESGRRTVFPAYAGMFRPPSRLL